MMNMDITSKSAYKLLQQLESDPQLQSVEDTSILNDEQYPTSFESAITNLKDIIPLISAVTILRWNESKDSKNLTQDQLQRMRTQKQKTVRNLILNATLTILGIRSSLTFGKIGLPTFVWAPLRLHSKVMKILPL
jgi:hypothetical protein